MATTAPISFADWKAGQSAAPADSPTAPVSFADWKASKAAKPAFAEIPASGAASSEKPDSFLGEAKPAAKAPEEKNTDSLSKKIVMRALHGAEALGENAGALFDVAASFPGAVIGGMGTAVFAGIGALKGEQDQKSLWKAATEFGKDIAEDNPLAHPVKSIMEWAGHKEGYSNSTVVSVLDKFSSFIQKGGAYAEEKIGIPAEAVNALTEQLTNLGMMKGGELIHSKLSGKAPEAPKPAGPPPSDISFAGPALDAEAATPGASTVKPKMGEGMEDLQARQKAQPVREVPRMPGLPPEKQDQTGQETVPPAEATPPVGAEGPRPEEVPPAPLGAMSHANPDGTTPHVVEEGFRDFGGPYVPPVDAMTDTLNFAAGVSDPRATATPSTLDTRKYATSIGNDNVKVAEHIHSNVQELFGQQSSEYQKSNAGIPAQAAQHAINYMEALKNAKSSAGASKAAFIKQARESYEKLQEIEKGIHGDIAKADQLRTAKQQQVKSDFAEKDTSTWKQTGKQLGSNEGGTYMDANGTEWYVKTPKTEDHVRNENLAAYFYEEAGIAVPLLKEVTHNGKPAVASRIVKNVTPGATEHTKGVKSGFATDAWLANWDVAGLGMDNIHTDENGLALRLDTGGALRYRAKGESKKLSQIVHEFNSLRDSNTNPQSAKLFKNMTDQELIDSIKRVEKISDARVEELVKKYGPKDAVENEKLVDILILRKSDLVKKRVALENKIAAAKAVTASTLNQFPKPDYSKIPTHKAAQAEEGIGAAGYVKEKFPDWNAPEFPDWLKAVVKSPNFKNFYGNSIFKDADGNPMIRYHGTKGGSKGSFLAFMQSDISSIGKVEKIKSGVFSAGSFEHAKGYSKGTGQVLPLFVRAERPFDYLNQAHVDAVVQRAKEIGQYISQHQIDNIKVGSFGAMEHANFLKALRSLKADGMFDSYFTSEGGYTGPKRNISVLDRTQLKSVFNPGKFSRTNPNMYGFGTPALLGTIAATGAIGLAVYKETQDPYEAALFTVGAAGLAAILVKHGGMEPSEFSKLGEEYWKPDFNTMLDPRYLGRALQWTKMATTADTTVLWQNLKNARKVGVSEAMDRKFRNVSEDPKTINTLSAEERVLYEQYVMPLKAAMAEQLNKIQDPAERQMVAHEIETRAAKNHRAWWDAITDGSEGIGPRGFQKAASATKARSVFALEDGTIITVKKLPSAAGKPGDFKVTAWKDNVRTDLGLSKTNVTKGSDFAGQKVVSAKQIDIEKHTPIRYVDSDIATHSLKLGELMKYTREKELVDNLLQSPAAQGLFAHEKYGQIPPGFVQPEGSMSIPSLRGVFMPKEYAEVFGDFIKKNKGSENLLEGAKNIMIRAMMLNPYAHIMNEMVHWYDSRGISGFITPTGVGAASKGLYGMAATMPDAVRSVILQDKFQIEMQKTGGFLLYPAVKNQRAWNNILQTSLTQAVKTGSFKEMAIALGTSPARLAKKISDMGSSIMWATRDIMYTQLVKEQVLMGKTMEEAIKETGKHMPEYYIPSRIIADNQLGRVASKTLQSPLLVFSPYHYGMVKAVKEIGKDMTSGKMNHMANGLDRAAAIMVALTVLYPVLDEINQNLTGQDEAKQRRAGIYHIINSVGEIMDGKKDASSLVSSLLTPNPAIVTAIEELQNHYLWSGQPIRHEGASAKAQALETARHLASKLKPAQTVDDVAYAGRKSWEQAALAELDIQAKSKAQIARSDAARKGRETQGKKAEKKFNKTYGLDD